MQDRRDVSELYRILEDEVLPAYFSRDANGLPTRWLPIMKRSIATSVHAFSTKRMLEDYMSQMVNVHAAPS